EQDEEKRLEDELRRLAEYEEQGQLERQEDRHQPWQRTPVLFPLEPRLRSSGRREIRLPAGSTGELPPPIGNVAAARARNRGAGDEPGERNVRRQDGEHHQLAGLEMERDHDHGV